MLKIGYYTLMYDTIDTPNILTKTPTIVNRLGKHTFLEIPLYRAKPYIPLYINKYLFRKYILNKKKLTWDFMQRYITQIFSCTINLAESISSCIGYAYVDKQVDPLGVSLLGNLGSGRAFFVGESFNIKGEKTPLATSENPLYNNGFQDMENGIWECMMYNILQKNVHQGLSPILAVLDTKKTYAPDNDTILRPWVIIIRINQKNCLERITNIIYSKKPITPRQIYSATKKFAYLEADKYIERLVHGMWSPGNITLNGQMIDLQSASFTKGRSPTYSATMWYPDNYFGFEHYGQLKILYMLKTITNMQQIKFAYLSKMFTNYYINWIAYRLLDMMGLYHKKIIFNKYKTILLNLATKFVHISQKGYFCPMSMFNSHQGSHKIFLYDISKFCMLYPLLDQNYPLDVAGIINLITNNQPPKSPASLLYQLTNNEREYLTTKVFRKLAKCFTPYSKIPKFYKQELVKFINEYTKTHKKITTEMQLDYNIIAARALHFNESRTFLMASNYIVSNMLKVYPRSNTKYLDNLIAACINASKRDFETTIINDKSYLQTLTSLYYEGTISVILDQQGDHKIFINLYADTEIFSYTKNMTLFQIIANDTNITEQIDFVDEKIRILSKNIPNDILIKYIDDPYCYYKQQLTILYNGQAITMTPLITV